MSERNEEALRSLWRELADKGIEQGVDWPRIARTLFADLDRLQRWKAEALVLFDGLQDLGRALELPLGTLVTGPLAVEAATALRDRLHGAEAEAHNLSHEVDRVRERLWRLAALAGWRPGNPADNDATAELYAAEALGQEPAAACPDCGHQHTANGCAGEPTPSDRWAGVSPAVCDCPGAVLPQAGAGQ